MTPLFTTKGLLHPSISSKIEGYKRVTYESRFVELFHSLLAEQSECLYNHHPLFPFCYLNTGKYKLYLNEDATQDKIIPVVQKNGLTSSFEIYSPSALYEHILYAVEDFDKISSKPIKIRDVTKQYADCFLLMTKGWQKVRTSLDVMQDTKLITELAGRNFSSIRNTLRRVERDYQPKIELLCKSNMYDAIQVFKNWQQLQGKKYFRVTIGRDIRLIEEFCNNYDVLDPNYFAYVYYVNDKAEAVSFGVRSWYRDEYGIDVTCKANTALRGLGDFAFHHLITEMRKAGGINYVNDSGYNSKGNEISKKKWFGGKEIKFVEMYDLVRI